MIAPITTGYAVSTAGLDALFQRLAELSGKSIPAHLRARAGLLARLLASYTQPVADTNASAVASFAAGRVVGSALGSAGAVGGSSGLDNFARNLGRSAVSRDISRVYVPLSRIYLEIEKKIGRRVARAFSKLVRENVAQAGQLLRHAAIRGGQLEIKEWDSGARHRQMRTKQGRINKGVKPIVITQSKELKDYRKKKVEMVGFAKSSWINAARQIPGAKGFGRIPSWIRKHNAPGRGIDRTQGATSNPHVILESGLPWMEDAFSSRTNLALFKHFGDLIQKELEAAIKALEAKAATRSLAKAA